MTVFMGVIEEASADGEKPVCVCVRVRACLPTSGVVIGYCASNLIIHNFSFC